MPLISEIPWEATDEKDPRLTNKEARDHYDGGGPYPTLITHKDSANNHGIL